MFRAHFVRGFWQHVKCFVGSTLERAESCRDCGVNYTCKDYLLRQKLWLVAYNGCAFDGLMRLDVE